MPPSTRPSSSSEDTSISREANSSSCSGESGASWNAASRPSTVDRIRPRISSSAAPASPSPYSPSYSPSPSPSLSSPPSRPPSTLPTIGISGRKRSSSPSPSPYSPSPYSPSPYSPSPPPYSASPGPNSPYSASPGYSASPYGANCSSPSP